jgi:antitoxin ParD1/3/4
MALVKKSITVTAGQEQWIRTQVASGEYGNDSEYVRDLIRRDEERNAQCRIVKEAIQQGLASGISEETVKRISAEAELRYSRRRRGRLLL